MASLLVLGACRSEDPLAAKRHAMAEQFAGQVGDLLTADPRRAVVMAELAARADPLDPKYLSLELRAHAIEALTLQARLPADRWVRVDAEAAAGLANDPEFAHVYQATLSMVMWLRGDAATASRDLVEIVKQKPDWALGHHLLARTLEAFDKPAEALLEYEAAIRTDKTGRGPWADAGRLFLASGDTAKAIERLEEALAHGDDAQLRKLLAQAYDRVNRGLDATAQLARAVGFEPTNANTRLAYADHLVQQGQLAQAQAEYTVASRNGGEPLATRGLGLIAVMSKDWPRALKSFELVLQLAPTDASTLFFAGEASDELKKPADAVKYYERFMEVAATQPAEADRAALVKERLARLKK